jgi:hypothetical protein
MGSVLAESCRTMDVNASREGIRLAKEIFEMELKERQTFQICNALNILRIAPGIDCVPVKNANVRMSLPWM